MSQPTVNKLHIYTALLFLLSGCGGGSGGGDGTALLSWNPPTRNTDDSVLTDLAGFRIYYGMLPGEYDKTITINNEGLSSYLVENLAFGDWCFVMTAFNSYRIESAYSAEVCKTVIRKEIDQNDKLNRPGKTGDSFV